MMNSADLSTATQKSSLPGALALNLHQPTALYALAQFGEDILGAARQAVRAVLRPAPAGAPSADPPSCAAAIADLPAVALSLGRGEAGHAIRRHLQGRLHDGQVRDSVSVLLLPERAGDYLRGRCRQALRTNVARADALGIVSRPASAAELARHARSLHGQPGAPKYLRRLLAERAQASMEHWVSVDAHGAPLALARVQIDGGVAWVKYMAATDGSRGSGVRYQLSACLFTSLAQRGVRAVIVGSTRDLSAGLEYFQQRLGFAPMRATIRDA